MDTPISVVLPIALAVALLASLFYDRRRARSTRRNTSVGLYRILGAVVLLGIAAIPRPNMTVKLPAQKFLATDGSLLRLDAFRGKSVVVNIWASWCPPCRREMPVLIDQQKRNPDVVFVFANQGESIETVQAFLAASGGAIDNVTLDDRKVLTQLAGVAAMPTTLFFDREGTLRKFHVGELSRVALLRYLGSLTSREPR